MKLYELRFLDIFKFPGMRMDKIGLFFSLENAKASIDKLEAVQWTLVDDVAWYGHGQHVHVAIDEIATDDEPDFTTLAGEVFYATAE
jgi:hypothetical protein